MFVLLIGIYLLGAGINLWDKLDRVGAPDVGWIIDDGNISPTRSATTARSVCFKHSRAVDPPTFFRQGNFMSEENDDIREEFDLEI